MPGPCIIEACLLCIIPQGSTSLYCNMPQNFMHHCSLVYQGHYISFGSFSLSFSRAQEDDAAPANGRRGALIAQVPHVGFGLCVCMCADIHIIDT